MSNLSSNSASLGAVSAYAPIRRNSFLQHPSPAQSSLANRLSTLTLGLTLVVIRFWKDAHLWQDVLAKLPSSWQRIIQGQLRNWKGSTSDFLRNWLRRLLQGLHDQMAPFLRLKSRVSRTMIVSNNGGSHPPKLRLKQQQQQKSHGHGHGRSDSGDAPSSIHFWDDVSATEQVTLLSSDFYEDRIRQNQCLIRKVLRYWFGQYDPDTAQKKLWMIANSSSQWRAKIDAEITDLFAPLLCELASAGMEETATTTTSTTDDEDIPASSRWQQWCADKEMYGYAGKLAAIIVLDQFSRHIRRCYDEQQSAKESNTQGNNTSLRLDHRLPPQSQLEALALRTAELFTQAHAQEIQCGVIPVPQYIFGLMPYRHASTLASVQYVQSCVEEAAQLQEQMEGMTSRFRKATNRRMAVLQDEARRTGKATIATATTTANLPTVASETTITTTNVKESEERPVQSTIDRTQIYSDEAILETFPFDADMTNAPDHPVVKTIQSFLADRGIHPTSEPSVGINEKKKQKGKQKNKKREPKSSSASDNAPAPTADRPTACSLIVSLSGGVDSMVIASVLAFLKRQGGYSDLNIVAVHIDYANRPESQAESDYVQKYCAQHGIRFVVRRIDEITRGVTARDEYEQRARTVRYDMYRTMAKECAVATSEDQIAVGVMLGHHRGDLRENVLSNAHKGCGPLDLSGMTSVSQNDGVTIYRPLLPLEKREVFDYAHRFGVPYFKDTTPHWSTRGKLRNKLLPLLEEIYGEGSMNNLSTLATESDECRDLLHDALLKPFMNRVVRYPMGISFETAPFVREARGLFFWKFVLREVLHSAGLGMFSDKSVLSFLERIDPRQTYKKTIRQGWLQCRRDYAVYLQADGKVFVFYPDSFPWRKTDSFTCIGQSYNLEKQATQAVGPWIVEAEVCDSKENERDALIKQKAISSMSQFMDGFVEYYLEVPTTRRADVIVPVPLIFISAFRKNTRPPAWKNTDEKIQEVLPLLAVADESSRELKDPTDGNPAALIRVTLDRRFAASE